MWNYDFDDYSNDDPEFDDIFHLLEEIAKEIHNLPKNRTVHSDKQVMSFEDIEIGSAYLWHFADGSTQIIMIASNPYTTDHGWFIDYQPTGWDHIADASLFGMGILPMENGGWSPTNWLEVLD